jgi:hypothetical protein
MTVMKITEKKHERKLHARRTIERGDEKKNRESWGNAKKHIIVERR